MSIRNSLLHIHLRPCTNNEWEKLHHVILTSNKDWDPTALDFEYLLDNELWFDAQSLFLDRTDDKKFNETGD